LVNHDVDGWLVVFGGREDLALGGWDCGVPWDKRSHDSAKGLNSKGKRSDVEKDDILNVAGDDGALKGSTTADGFVWVDGKVDFVAGDLTDHILDGWHTDGAADHKDLTEVAVFEFGISHGFLHWGLASL